MGHVTGLCEVDPSHFRDVLKERRHRDVVRLVEFSVRKQCRHVDLGKSVNDRPAFQGASSEEFALSPPGQYTVSMRGKES